jgi:hypothetical protein
MLHDGIAHDRIRVHMTHSAKRGDANCEAPVAAEISTTCPTRRARKSSHSALKT